MSKTCKYLRGALAGVIAAGLTALACAQPAKYKSDAELMGAALASPEGVRQVIDRLVRKCGTYGPTVRSAGDAAFAGWQSRHRAYLDEGLRVKAELQAAYTEPEARARFDELLRTQLPALVERQYAVYETTINDQLTEEGRIGMCTSYFHAIDQHQFDLKVNDPALAAFFDKRIAARQGAGGATPSAPVVPSPDQRSDAPATQRSLTAPPAAQPATAASDAAGDAAAAATSALSPVSK